MQHPSAPEMQFAGGFCFFPRLLLLLLSLHSFWQAHVPLATTGWSRFMVPGNSAACFLRLATPRPPSISYLRNINSHGNLSGLPIKPQYLLGRAGGRAGGGLFLMVLTGCYELLSNFKAAIFQAASKAFRCPSLTTEPISNDRITGT